MQGIQNEILEELAITQTPQVLNVGNTEAVDCKADTAYMFTVAHKDITHDLYESTPEACKQAWKATTHYI